MSDASGWHPDPRTPGTWAYWDGTQWLDRSAAVNAGAPEAPTTPPPPVGTAASAAAGWAPPISGQGAPGYWQASDGNWYPPSQQPAFQAFQPPPAGYVAAQPVGYGPPVKTNGLAIASMVLGILWLYWVGSILALIFGYIAKNAIDRSGGREAGRGMAIAGIVLGWIGVAVLTLVIVAGVFFASSSSFEGVNTDPSDGYCNYDRFMQDPDC